MNESELCVKHSFNKTTFDVESELHYNDVTVISFVNIEDSCSSACCVR